MECLQDWGSYMKLALPSAFMICFEWWVWEIGGFLAGAFRDPRPLSTLTE